MNFKRIIINLVLITIIVLLTFVPDLGYFMVFNRTITIIYIPIIIGGLIYKESGIILSLVYGLCTLVEAYVNPYGAVDLINQNVIVSVFPKLMFGIIIFYIYDFAQKHIRKTLYISLTITGLSILHSLLLTIAFYFSARTYLEFDSGFFKYVVTLLDIFTIEAVLSLLIGYPLIKWIYELIY